MRLGIDIDGVLAAYQYEYDVHGRAVRPEENWWLPEVYSLAEPVEGSLDGMRALHDDGHKLVVITARAPHEATSAWLNEHGYPFTSLHHTKAKWEIPCHIYLDDGVQFLNGIYERGLVGVRFRYPHNAGAFARYEVDSWPEFVALVRGGARGKLRRNPRRLLHVA